MRKTFMGVRLRRLREERGLKQVELAKALGISPSYLNQLEQNQRPLTLSVLLRLNAAFGMALDFSSAEEELRLVSDLRAAMADGMDGETVSVAELRELVVNMPAVARGIVALHRSQREASDRVHAMAAQLGDDWISEAPARMPYEQVRDFFYARHNHIAELDETAERIYRDCGFGPRAVHAGLLELLGRRHGVRVIFPETAGAQRHYEPGSRRLSISAHLHQGRQAFQLATQLAFLEAGDVIDTLAADPALDGDEAQALARIGLANYFAGALILPYGRFLRAAEEYAYDIERLGRHFGVGFETVCHRLSTLRRPEARGVPFFFVRVDRAGNISKRQSANDFHFSRVGGSCPLWNVYEAFAQPGRLLTQIAQMPDGRTYLWLARTVSRPGGTWGKPGTTFAIGLGCDIRHAGRIVYSKGLALDDPSAATPIGAGCKICERATCPQRAFPPIGRRLAVEVNRAPLTPYRVAD